MHMWLALHAHRRVHPQQYTLIIQHAQETCRILRRWIHGTPVKNAESKGSPHQVRTVRKAKGKTASVRAVAAATRKPKASKVAPTTPKRPRSKFVTLNSFDVSNLRPLQSPIRLKGPNCPPCSTSRKTSHPCGNRLAGSYHF